MTAALRDLTHDSNERPFGVEKAEGSVGGNSNYSGQYFQWRIRQNLMDFGIDMKTERSAWLSDEDRAELDRMAMRRRPPEQEPKT